MVGFALQPARVSSCSVLVRFGCARTPRIWGIGWGRTDEESAASVGHSSRVSDCREVPRTQLLRDFTHSGGRWKNLCSTCGSSRWTGLGAAHPSDSCAIVFIENRCRPQEPVGNCLQSSSGSHRILARLAATTHSFVGPACCMGLLRRSRGDLGTVHSLLRGRRTRTFVFASGEGTERKQDGETFGSRRDRGASSEAPTPSRVSGHNVRSHGRIYWQAGRPRSQWGCAHSNGVQFGSCELGKHSASRSRAAQRHTRLALCLEPVQASVASVKSIRAVPSKKKCGSPQTSRTCRSTCKAGFSSGQAQKRTFSGGGVRSGSGSCDNRSGTHRGSPRWRIRGRAPAAGRPCPGAAHSTYPSRVPWSYHCDGRDESVGATREGTRSSLLRALPNFTKGRRDGLQEPSTRAESEDSNASMQCCARTSENSSPQRRTLATTRPEVGPCSDCPAPTLSHHWSPAEASAAIT